MRGYVAWPLALACAGCALAHERQGPDASHDAFVAPGDASILDAPDAPLCVPSIDVPRTCTATAVRALGADGYATGSSSVTTSGTVTLAVLGLVSGASLTVGEHTIASGGQAVAVAFDALDAAPLWVEERSADTEPTSQEGGGSGAFVLASFLPDGRVRVAERDARDGAPIGPAIEAAVGFEAASIACPTCRSSWLAALVWSSTLDVPGLPPVSDSQGTSLVASDASGARWAWSMHGPAAPSLSVTLPRRSEAEGGWTFWVGSFRGTDPGGEVCVHEGVPCFARLEGALVTLDAGGTLVRASLTEHADYVRRIEPLDDGGRVVGHNFGVTRYASDGSVRWDLRDPRGASGFIAVDRARGRVWLATPLTRQPLVLGASHLTDCEDNRRFVLAAIDLETGSVLGVWMPAPDLGIHDLAVRDDGRVVLLFSADTFHPPTAVEVCGARFSRLDRADGPIDTVVALFEPPL